MVVISDFLGRHTPFWGWGGDEILSFSKGMFFLTKVPILDVIYIFVYIDIYLVLSTFDVHIITSMVCLGMIRLHLVIYDVCSLRCPRQDGQRVQKLQDRLLFPGRTWGELGGSWYLVTLVRKLSVKPIYPRNLQQDLLNGPL